MVKKHMELRAMGWFGYVLNILDGVVCDVQSLISNLIRIA